MKDVSKARSNMVERQIAGRGVRSELVLDAMNRIPREIFLPQRLHEFAYDDTPLPIDADQTISQPYSECIVNELTPAINWFPYYRIHRRRAFR